jgi:D-amino-acid oxidase
VYLGWLRGECEQRGAEFIQRTVAPLDSLLTEEPLVVDCAGFGARELAGDSSVEAVRGQVVLVSAPAIATFIIDGANPEGTTYVFPRTDCVVVGGTSERGMTSLAPDAATRDAILRRASKLVPALAGAPVIGEAVGLRPARPEVRVETEVRPLGTVVHNYGHGGSGVTLSWGCAEEATALVLGALDHAEAS